MTSNFDNFKSDHDLYLGNWEGNDTEQDCFELLSAYLDGEVTPQERQQVQYWLDHDPQIKQIYTQLRKLHHDLENIPLPTTNNSTQELSAQVFQKIDRSHRQRRLIVWGGGAIAAMVLAGLSSLLSGGDAPGFKMAESMGKKDSTEAVMVALNKPAVKIPKAPVSSPKVAK